MVNRPAGGARSQRHLRAPLDWYVEPVRSPEQLFHAIDFGGDFIWDGCCGKGTILDVAAKFGHPTFGSDLADRGAVRCHDWTQLDILKTTRLPFRLPPGVQLSYVSNPPYGYMKDIAEKIMRHVLTEFPVRRAAFLVPIAFLASEGRFRLFTRDFRPSHIAVHSDRITCPPGHQMAVLDRLEGGMADYVWVVFTRPHRWRTETVWLPPGRHPSPPQFRARDTRGESNATTG